MVLLRKYINFTILITLKFNGIPIHFYKMFANDC